MVQCVYTEVTGAAFWQWRHHAGRMDVDWWS